MASKTLPFKKKTAFDPSASSGEDPVLKGPAKPMMGPMPEPPVVAERPETSSPVMYKPEPKSAEDKEIEAKVAADVEAYRAKSEASAVKKPTLMERYIANKGGYRRALQAGNQSNGVVTDPTTGLAYKVLASKNRMTKRSSLANTSEKLTVSEKGNQTGKPTVQSTAKLTVKTPPTTTPKQTKKSEKVEESTEEEESYNQFEARIKKEGEDAREKDSTILENKNDTYNNYIKAQQAEKDKKANPQTTKKANTSTKKDEPQTVKKPKFTSFKPNSSDKFMDMANELMISGNRDFAKNTRDKDLLTYKKSIAKGFRGEEKEIAQQMADANGLYHDQRRGNEKLDLKEKEKADRETKAIKKASSYFRPKNLF